MNSLVIKKKLYDPIVDWLFRFLFSNVTLFVAFFLSINLITILVAIKTNVWSGITYPLNQSYTAWLGDFVLSLSNIFIIGFYATHNLKPLRINNALRIYILCLAISGIFHFLFTIDEMHGWCEIDSANGLSGLGYLHLLYSSTQFYIYVIFAFAVQHSLRTKAIRANHVNKLNLFLLTLSVYISILLYTSNIYSTEHVWALAEFILVPLFFMSALIYFNYIVTKLELIPKSKSIIIIGTSLLIITLPILVKSIFL